MAVDSASLEPPETPDPRPCGDCYHFEHCPSEDCAWGVCLANPLDPSPMWVRETDTEADHECGRWVE